MTLYVCNELAVQQTIATVLVTGRTSKSEAHSVQLCYDVLHTLGKKTVVTQTYQIFTKNTQHIFKLIIKLII